MTDTLNLDLDNAFVDDGRKQQFLELIQLGFKRQGDEIVIGLYDFDRDDTNVKGRCMRTHLPVSKLPEIIEFLQSCLDDDPVANNVEGLKSGLHSRPYSAGEQKLFLEAIRKIAQ